MVEAFVPQAPLAFAVMEQGVEIVAALIGDSANPFLRAASEEDWNRPYSERKTVRLDVARDDRLDDVLSRVGEAMGLEPPRDGYVTRSWMSKIAFYKKEDEHGFAPRSVPRFLLGQITLVDDHGRALFGVSDFRAIRYGDLMRAAEAGTLDGDPRRPYLIVEPPYGDWVGPDWPTLVEGLKVSWEVLEALATAGGAIASGKLIADVVGKRLRGGARAVNDNPAWAQRRTMPYEFTALARIRDWTASDLARLLDCSEPDAEAVLYALGFSYDDATRTWRFRGDPAAEVIRDVLDEIELAAHEHGDDLPGGLRARLEAYVRRGERLPFRWWESDQEIPDYSPSPGERIGGAVDGAISLAYAIRNALWRRRGRRSR